MRQLNRSGKRQGGVPSGRTVLGLCTSAIIVAFVGFVGVQLAFFGAATSSNDADNTLVVSQHTPKQAELVPWESESQGLDEVDNRKLELLYLPPHPRGLYNVSG